MTTEIPASPASTTGWDESTAQAWLDGGTNENDYLLSWRLAVTIAASDLQEDAPIILDMASGPGGFLAVALATMPTATGIWMDNFDAMEAEARHYLSSFDGRVIYRLGDLLDLEQITPCESISLITCSRATHHLEGETLNEFYAQAFSILKPGGWLANLDQMVSTDFWAPKLSAARRVLNPNRMGGVPGHPKAHPHTFEEHLAGARLAGLEEAACIWRLCQHSLVMARKPIEPRDTNH